jgi:hypothetical protein
MLKVLLGQSTMNVLDDKIKTKMVETLENMNDIDEMFICKNYFD